MPTAIHRKIRLAEQGELPSAILRLPSGWVVAGDVQPLQGYCVLLADPVARDFNALSESRRAQYALDMARVGDALLTHCGAYRINYETWGNLDPALHTHIVPRFENEPPDLRVLPPRQAYDWAKGRPFDPALDGAWMEKVRRFLRALILLLPET
jgi:diadenosine tetraphosphate (Ap4A) HIT family hydrolase